MQSEPNQTPVLIVGGSLVGLSAAVFLSWRGVPTILIEKHVGSSLHPRAIGYTSRTMEFFRAVGIVDSIPQTPPGYRLRRTRVESLAGKWLEESNWTPTPNGKEAQEHIRVEYSPYPGAAIAQDRLEPILRSRASELGADLRQGTELLRFEQDSKGVVAFVRERSTGNEYQIHAEYMIAADGGKSTIRETLEIPRKGRGYMQTVRSVLFRAELDEYLKSGFSQFEIEQPGLKAFLTTYQDGRWVLMFTDDAERDEKAAKEAVLKAIGRSDLEIEMITTGRWELTALIADHYSMGRIFLAGDAAHTLPPTRGGFGANTGIDDVYNLAWKLESVIAGKSSPKLLETYSEERQPIGWLRHQQTFARPDYASHSQGIAQGEKILDDIAIELGQLHRSSAVIGAGENLPAARKPDEWAGQPGTRAQHLWISQGEKRISTLDLFSKGWVLLFEDASWKTAVRETSKKLGIEIEGIQVGTDIKFSDENVFRTSFGLESTGASLIRPDGIVAWRSIRQPDDPILSITKALAQILCAIQNPATVV